MKITSKNICEKLGFDVLSYEPECPGYEDDSKLSHFQYFYQTNHFFSDYLTEKQKDTKTAP